MLLMPKKMAFLGILLAIDMLVLYSSNVIVINTVFLYSFAAYLTGVAIREMGIKLGIGFFVASVILGLFTVSEKLQFLTYILMGVYICIIEFLWENVLFRWKDRLNRKKIWIVKYLIFQVIYIPFVILFPRFIYTGEVDSKIMILVIAISEAGFFIFDEAYEYFQKKIWSRIRNKIIF